MNLDDDSAAAILAELGNPTRLRIVRLLVEAGAGGMAVGEIQRELAIPASTLSHHIAHLKSTRLVSQTRRSTTLNCCVDFATIDAVLNFLTERCCMRSGPSPATRRRN